VYVFQATLSHQSVLLLEPVSLCRYSTYKDLVEEVLDELLLKCTGLEEAMEIGSEELSNEVAV